MKNTPIEKIPEAYSAIIDGRITIDNNIAHVKSSDLSKEYLVLWKDNMYYSNDSATYWQGYLGYPIIAVLLLQGKLTYNSNIANYFKNINWHELNKKYKRDYKKALDSIINNLDNKEDIINNINMVYDEINKLDMVITKKKSIFNI